jgi:PAS domain S-box-containing protein
MRSTSTTHKHTEQALGYLSLIADTAAEKTNEGIVVADLNGSLLFLNEAWCEMHGYKSKDELIGKNISLFYTKEEMQTKVIPLLEKTKRCCQIEDTIEHIKSNRAVFAARTKTTSVRDGAGNVTGFIIFAANIGQSPKLKDTTVKNLKQIRHLSERIARLRKLFGECRDMGEYLAEQTNELRANNEMMLKRISELDRSSLVPGQYSEQIPFRKAQGAIIDELKGDTNPEPVVKSKRSHKSLDTEELRKVAELARRLSEFSKQNIRNEHTDVAVELGRCSTKTKTGKTE